MNRTISHHDHLPFEFLLLPNDNCTLYLHVIHLLDHKNMLKYTIQHTLIHENITIIIQLSIHIVDANDHFPLFSNEHYHFVVKENILPGGYIGRVQAYNQHMFSNSNVSYTLHGVDLKQLPNRTMFYIDKYTGDIFLSNYKLDYKMKQEYRIVVEAKAYEDNQTSASIHLSSFADIIITVEDGKHEKLEISFTMPHEHMNENSVKIMNISTVQLNKKEQNSFIISYLSMIDLVEDDTKIVFLIKEEPLPENTLLALLHLRDNDQITNGTVSFKLQTHVQCSNEGIFNTIAFCRLSNLFHLSVLGPNTYGLFNSQILDREQYENHIIHLIANKNNKQSVASNSKLNLLNAELFIYLVLLDINDNIPKFNRTHFHVNIDENEAKGKFLTRLHAYDPDKGTNGTIHYELVVKNQFFSINKYTGVLRTKRKLDRELCGLYRIGIRAYDLGVPQRKYSSIAIVDVEINNINDHVPYFMHDIYHFNVEENVPSGKIVGRLTIEDKDEQEPIEQMINLSTIEDGDIIHFNIKRSNTLTRVNYSMIDFLFIDTHRNESSSGLFSIDSQGFIHTIAVLDREIQSNYTLYIFIYDIVLKSYTAPACVIIEVLDENDNIPYEPFLSNSSILSIEQKNHDETIIYRFKPIDLDDGLNGLVSIECLNCSSVFYFYIINSSILITRPKIKVPDGIYTLAFLLRDHGLITSHKQFYTLTFNVTHRTNKKEQANGMPTDKQIQDRDILEQQKTFSSQNCQIMPDSNITNNHNLSEQEVLGNLNSISIENHSSQVILRSKHCSRSQNTNSHYQRSSSMMNSRETILTDAATNTSYHDDNNDIWQPMTNNNNNNNRILYENASTILHNKNYYFEPIDRDLSSNAPSRLTNQSPHPIQRPVPISNHHLNKVIEHSQQQGQQSLLKTKRNSTMNFQTSPTDSTLRSSVLTRSITTDQFSSNQNQTNKLYYYPSVQDVIDALNRHSNFKESIV